MSLTDQHIIVCFGLWLKLVLSMIVFVSERLSVKLTYICLQRVIGTELSYKTLGFSTVIDFIAAMPGVVAWERPSSGDWLLYRAGFPRPSSPPPSGMNRLLCFFLPFNADFFLVILSQYWIWLFADWHLHVNVCGGNEFYALTDIWNVVDAGLLCERCPAAGMPDHRKIIEEIMHSACGGILLSELPEKFEVSIY